MTTRTAGDDGHRLGLWGHDTLGSRLHTKGENPVCVHV